MSESRGRDLETRIVEDFLEQHGEGAPAPMEIVDQEEEDLARWGDEGGAFLEEQE
jgi:hypothetical protein